MENLVNNNGIRDPRVLLRTAFMIDGRREVSAQEAAHYLMQYPLVLTSFKYAYCNTSDERVSIGDRGINMNTDVNSDV